MRKLPLMLRLLIVPSGVSTPATFETFQAELIHLVEKFEQEFAAVKDPSYAEARLRQDYLDPLIRALGWDLENRAALLQHQRDVEIESRVDVTGRAKRADYLFRTDGRDRFTFEAKKPRDPLGPPAAFQAKRYAWNKDLALALLSDFEELKIYVVGGKPIMDQPDAGLWKVWHFKTFPSVATEIWKLLARDNIAKGSIDALLETLPQQPTTGVGGRQLYIVKPDRTRAIDSAFLDFLDEARRALASDILVRNDRAEMLDGGRLNDAVQSILDRLLFIRICEDRDIDTGTPLRDIVKRWRRVLDDRDDSAGNRRPRREALWTAIVRHIRALDRRPPSHIPFFNGNLFKTHQSEELVLGDEWLERFIIELSADESPYLFNLIPVEILGSVYERFLGKIVRPKGRGVVIEDKPEVKKAGGVYYTPRYIVEYVVEQTVGKQLDAVAKSKTPLAFDKNTRALRILDPACGSGSFLIRAFERVCEHWQRRFTNNANERKKELCWVDPITGDVSLTVDLKRRILQDSIFGVDIDAGAVEATQLSLYLKMLEGENRTTLKRQRDLFGSETALLPSLDNNVKCGNSLIASEFSLDPDDIVRVNAFDWNIAFRSIVKAGGFTAVIGNPPYLNIRLLSQIVGDDVKAYFQGSYLAARGAYDLYVLFIERSINLLAKGGQFGMIVPNKIGTLDYAAEIRKMITTQMTIDIIADVSSLNVFESASVYPYLILATRTAPQPSHRVLIVQPKTRADLMATPGSGSVAQQSLTAAAGFAIHGTMDVESRVVTLPLSSRCLLHSGTTGFSAQIIAAQLREKSSLVKGKCFEFVVSGNIDRYDVQLGDVRYMKRKFARPVLPADRDILSDNKISLYSGSKIIFAGMSKRLEVAYDAGGLALGVQVFAAMEMKDDYRYLLGILNSSLMSYLFRIRFQAKHLAGGYLAVNKGQLETLPIRIVGSHDRGGMKCRDAIIQLVDKMLVIVPKLRTEVRKQERQALQNAVQATDQMIDDHVCDLYGLTESEREIVENAVK